MISASAEKEQCLLLGEVCLAAGSRGWVQPFGMTSLLNVFRSCPRQSQKPSVCTENRSGEKGVDCTGKLVARHCGADTDRGDRGFCTMMVN